MTSTKPAKVREIVEASGLLAERTAFFVPNTEAGRRAMQAIKQHLNYKRWTIRVMARGPRPSRCQATTRFCDATHFALYLDKKDTEQEIKERWEQSDKNWQNQKDASYHRTYCAAQKQGAVQDAYMRGKQHGVSLGRENRTVEILSMNLFRLILWHFRKEV